MDQWLLFIVAMSNKVAYDDLYYSQKTVLLSSFDFKYNHLNKLYCLWDKGWIIGHMGLKGYL